MWLTLQRYHHRGLAEVSSQRSCRDIIIEVLQRYHHRGLAEVSSQRFPPGVFLFIKTCSSVPAVPRARVPYTTLSRNRLTNFHPHPLTLSQSLSLTLHGACYRVSPLSLATVISVFNNDFVSFTVISFIDQQLFLRVCRFFQENLQKRETAEIITFFVFKPFFLIDTIYIRDFELKLTGLSKYNMTFLNRSPYQIIF